MAVAVSSSSSRRKWKPWRGWKHGSFTTKNRTPSASTHLSPNDETVSREGVHIESVVTRGENACSVDISSQLLDKHIAEKNLTIPAENPPFQEALSDFICGMTDMEKADLQKCSQISMKGLLEQIEKLNVIHKSKSNYRKSITKIVEYFAWLPDVLAILDPIFQSNQPAAIALGAIKSIVQLVFRVQSSYEELSLEIERLLDCLENLAVYGEKCSSEPRVHEILVCIYKDLFSFYAKARQMFVEDGISDKTPRFIFSSFQKSFGKMISRIERYSSRLKDLSGSLTFALVLEDRKLRETGKTQQDIEEFRHKILVLLGYNRLDHFQSELESRVQGTCEWIRRDNCFCNWETQKENAILVLTGEAGFGKTMTTAYLVEYLEGLDKHGPENDGTLVCSFFCDNKDRMRNSKVSILHGLLSQIIEQSPDAVQHLQTWYRCHKESDLHKYHSLQAVFISTLETVQKDSIYLLIDAVDECNEEARETFFSTLSTIYKRRFPSTIKIMLTYRPSEAIHRQLSDKTFRISFDRGARHDFQLIVKSKLNSFQKRYDYSDGTRSKLEIEFLHKASNCPLWAKLMLQYLEGSSSSNEKKLLKLMQDIPPGLDNVYLALLRKIKPQDKTEAARALQMLAIAMRPLTLSELDQALAATQVQDSIGDTIAVVKETVLQDVNSCRENNFEHHIVVVLGSFIRIHNSKVHLIHLSAKEFVLGRMVRQVKPDSRSLSMENSQYLLSSYTCSSEDAHGVLANCCIKYLNLQDFGASDYSEKDQLSLSELPFQTTFDMESDGSPSRESTSPVFHSPSVQKFQNDENAQGQIDPVPFFEYASWYWMDHLAAASATEAAKLTELTMALSEARSMRLCNWADRYRKRIKAETWDDFPEDHELDPLVVAAYLGQRCVLATRLSMGDSDHMKDNLRLACVWAARMGRLEILKTLLKNGKLFVYRTEELGELLLNAVEYGHSSVVQFLLQTISPAQASLLHTDKSTPLSIAVSKGFADITKMLLTSSEENIDPMMSLFCAVPIFRSGESPGLTAPRKEILASIVKSKKIDLAYRNPRDGRTVLSWVAESGCIESMKIILNAGRDEDLHRLLTAEHDNAGRSPILYAARWGHIEILKLLCRQANIENQFHVKYPEDETPIAAAARNGHIEAVKLLAAIDPGSIDRRDPTVGRTPLSLAVHAVSGGAEVARALLATGRVDVESKSSCGWTPLRYAVESARLEIIRVLVAEGKADMKEVFCIENGQPRLLVRPTAAWDAPQVCHVLSLLAGSSDETM